MLKIQKNIGTVSFSDGLLSDYFQICLWRACVLSVKDLVRESHCYQSSPQFTGWNVMFRVVLSLVWRRPTPWPSKSAKATCHDYFQEGLIRGVLTRLRVNYAVDMM